MSRGNAVRLNQTMINSMKEGDELWDLVPGLHVRAGKRGKTFRYLYVSPVYRKQRRGTLGMISLDEARAAVEKWRKLISAGEDPQDVQEREMQRTAPATLKNIQERWEIEAQKSEQIWEDIQKNNRHFELNKKGRKKTFIKPNTISLYRIQWRDILGFFGESKTVISLTKADIAKLHQKFSIKGIRKGSVPARGGLRKANTLVNFLSWRIRDASKWGIIEDDDAVRLEYIFKKIERHPEYGKERVLTPKEIKACFDTLDKLRGPITDKGKKKSYRQLMGDRTRADLIELMMVSGARLGEFMAAKLSWVDWNQPEKVIKLRDTKGGAVEVPLGDDESKILKRRCEEWHARGAKPEEDWVIPSLRKYGFPMTNPQNGIKGFRKLAKLPSDITAHTFRHTWLTMGVGLGGVSLGEASKMIGHASESTTAGYVHEMHVATVASKNKTGAVFNAIKHGTLKLPENDIVPDYIRMQRENAKRLQVELPPTSTTH